MNLPKFLFVFTLLFFVFNVNVKAENKEQYFLSNAKLVVKTSQKTENNLFLKILDILKSNLNFFLNKPNKVNQEGSKNDIKDKKISPVTTDKITIAPTGETDSMIICDN